MMIKQKSVSKTKVTYSLAEFICLFIDQCSLGTIHAFGTKSIP